MRLNFNLFKLHKSEEDFHPRSWIEFSGKNLKQTISDLERQITDKYGISREKLSEKIAENISCSKSLIKYLLRGESNFYPVPFIIQMYGFVNKDYSTLNSEIKHIKVNSASAKPIKAAKTITQDLAKIVGAYMADGSMTYQLMIANNNESKLKKIEKILNDKKIKFGSGYTRSRKEYFVCVHLNKNNIDFMLKLPKRVRKHFKIQRHIRMEFTDEHKSSINSLRKWIDQCFGIKTKLSRKKRAWRIGYTNKIVARYLISFFDIKPGYKTDIAFEPKLIRNSSFKIRKAFALGVLTFDGSSDISGRITFQTKSEKLFKSISEIFTKDNIYFGVRIIPDSFIIFTYRKNRPNNLLKYFEKNTTKWFRLQESYRKSTSTNFEKRYNTYPTNKVSFENLLKMLREIKSCDIAFLSNCFKCRHTTIVKYLTILENNNKINFSNKPKRINPEFINKKASLFLKRKFHDTVFSEIRKKFIEYKRFAIYMDIHKATISAWKVRKNRIPLDILQKICKEIKIDTSKIYDNIKETDRKIVEFIT